MPITAGDANFGHNNPPEPMPPQQLLRTDSLPVLPMSPQQLRRTNSLREVHTSQNMPQMVFYLEHLEGEKVLTPLEM